MSDIFSNLVLDGADFGRYTVAGEANQPTRVLAGLSRVNFFVGPNNSGKSRFLRELTRIDKLRFGPDGGFVEIAKIAADFKAGIDEIICGGVTEVGGFKAGTSNYPSFDFITEGEEPFDEVRKLINRAGTAEPDSYTIQTVNFATTPRQLTRKIKHLGEQVKNIADPLFASLPTPSKLLRIYIPALRGLRPFEGVGDCYADRTQKDYFRTTPVPTIFTGLTLHTELEAMLLGDLAERKSVERFQLFLSQSFFGGQDVALIPRKGAGVLYIKIGDEVELPIYSLGDGIQMIIIITFPLFQNAGKPAVVCIEEPELFLHPGLQRVLLKTLISFPENRYFVATHSNHLLDLSLEFEGVSIFTFHKELEDSDAAEKHARFNIERVSSHDQRTLQLLGTRNSSVFLANCTIWVEGITDRRYLAHFLDLYQKRLRDVACAAGDPTPLLVKEDLHYSFVEYAGSNITHWSFLDEIKDPIEVERLCSRLMLITDRDETADTTKQERHAKLAEKLGDRYCRLDCREIENLLPPKVLVSVVTEYEGEKVELNPVRYEDYKNARLGEFIETSLLMKKRRRGSYKAESGTISDKLTFCDRAIANTQSFADMSDEAQQLIKRVYEFICGSNQ